MRIGGFLGCINFLLYNVVDFLIEGLSGSLEEGIGLVWIYWKGWSVGMEKRLEKSWNKMCYGYG